MQASPIAFDNAYAKLPPQFHARLAPTPVAAPRLLRLNLALADELGLDANWLAGPDGVAMLAGNRMPEGADPLAMVYAGHQFGHWVPQLGDGRAILLGEVRDREGVRREIQLKGSGRTPFSRSGDGRAAIGPVLREYIVSEAMAALGIRTTRSLAAVATGERVYRESVQPGAILTRVARSHVRVGTFQFFAARGDAASLRQLADHVIANLVPEAAGTEEPHRAFLDATVARTADLIASWQLVGFIHGVMNTDNMSIAGETIDYGPCAFMDAYHPGTVFSSIDSGGRYAFANQPRIAHWNLAQLAQSLLPLLGADEGAAVEAAQAALDAFPARFEASYLAGLRRKLGLGAPREGDAELARDLLDRMSAQSADFTLTFRLLCGARCADASADGPVRALFADPAAFDAWAENWRRRLAVEGSVDEARQASMRRSNPVFIPRNHRVAAVLDAAEAGNLGPLDELLAVLSKPFDDQPAHAGYAEPPKPHEVVHATFCGT
jgi:uncharacterized protein YdiU (UPF0061 family)